MKKRKLTAASLYFFILILLATGCAAPKSTIKKTLSPFDLHPRLSLTVACVRDVSDESVASGLFDREKREIELSEAAEMKLGHLLQDSNCLKKVRIIPHSEMPSDATELTCVSLARKEGTDLVLHGELNHRASMTLNWLTWPSYIPGLVVGAPLWSPNYTLKSELELTIHVVDAHNLERIITRKFTEEAFTSICFLTRVTALHDRYTDLQKNIALHNASVEAVNLLLNSIATYEPGKSTIKDMAPTGKVIAVADFQTGSDFVKRMGYGVEAADKFTAAFSRSGYFKVMERQRIRDILAERDFAMTDLVKGNKADQIAKLLGVDYVLVGSVAKVGTRLEVNARLLEISTGKVLLTVSDGITRDADLQILIELMARRAMENYARTVQNQGK
jgi:TolB-like protein